LNQRTRPGLGWNGAQASPVGDLNQATKTDDEFMAFYPRLDLQLPATSKPEVDIVPGDGRVPPARRPRHHARMRMPLDDVAAGLQRDVVKRVRQLTKPPANRRNETAPLQHAADHKAATAARPPDLLPETEQSTGGQHGDRAGGSRRRSCTLPN
jgi:hypothetical protein